MLLEREIWIPLINRNSTTWQEKRPPMPMCYEPTTCTLAVFRTSRPFVLLLRRGLTTRVGLSRRFSSALYLHSNLDFHHVTFEFRNGALHISYHFNIQHWTSTNGDNTTGFGMEGYGFSRRRVYTVGVSTDVLNGRNKLLELEGGSLNGELLDSHSGISGFRFFQFLPFLTFFYLGFIFVGSRGAKLGKKFRGGRRLVDGKA
ncbi:hypothetical protein CI102_10354 [Trichoderma harzianum]|uniref:Uncharacterized protein n=1 Tax=Trichoderma harzianum CBS 226.95 TaxID=983964 RepID=A0A2T4AAH4_TRIHA|nr:hypothetical protein M431DRAFT_449640 [Trichoderma harzianum CBS 226.95]PKK45636.1 hypothetical protein CI102_10354 [Trichoderma harzianum]PTB54077.1 hypothetical protein M431DRAFT_449640 [Trichoderma harzianum CBS 226.95]